MPHKNELRPDEITEDREIKSPAALGVRTLLGYVGESDQSDFVRLYVEADLSDYYEIRKKDVVGRDHLPDEDAAIAASALHVDSSASVYRVRCDIVDLQLGMLEGEVTEALLGRLAEAGLAEWAAPALERLDAAKRNTGGGFFCTLASGCTEGKRAGRECTDKFGRDDEYHMTKDREC